MNLMCFHSPQGFVLALISLIVFPVKHSNCLYNQAAGTARICACVFSMASINIHFSVCLSMCMRMCAVIAKHKRVFVIIRITARARSR